MLKTLNVSNFALIDDVSVEFFKGLTALTGETGSGKSILLESLALIFGKRADQDMIRFGEKKAVVKAGFILNKDQQERLELPENITIIREVENTGRHQIRLNDELITLTKLKEISKVIGSIHAQADTFGLMDKTLYLDFIDQMGEKDLNQIYNEYILLREDYLEQVRNYKKITSKKEESLEKVDFLSYQVKELESLNLVKDEKEEIEEILSKLQNFDKIKQALIQSYQSLENEQFNLDSIYESYQSLNRVSDFDPKYKKNSEELLNLYYGLDEIKKEIHQELSDFDFDEETFNEYQERIYQLTKVEQKYQKSISELIIYLEEIKNELEKVTDYDNYVKKALERQELTYQKAYKKASELSEVRKKLALKLEKEMINHLKDLDLEKAQFQIHFEKNNEKPELYENGIDQVEFMISLNEGEPIKPLSKVASGGEKARFMFAFKSIYATTHKLSLLVLDEIDIGISGKTAAKVANKMLELSKILQTIVITHLPQVASKANYHYLIEKEKKDNRMVTRINTLEETSRVEAIALMLSDDKITKEAIALAKSMLDK